MTLPKLIVENTKEVDYSSLHFVKENVSLNCVTPNYYVWYPWLRDDTILFTNRISGALSAITLKENIGKNSLSYFEDVTGGLKMANDDDKNLYIMIMKKENNVKKLIVYQLSNIP